ncbi:hypothetical protein DVR12_17635 [Chitinophaga silvatica]|uniref:Uncharacterized protein n=1 Tax=Chitinophaga silvatica TaxID=2282649 RepID=A0A3E1Y7U9_9BACT|nr:hypothetical protein [Chitinophaga silvatica]RFS21157.1 hypothetical protein DVR12_17635 [Chitinophaga silvatica]
MAKVGAASMVKGQRTKFLYGSYVFNGSADFGNCHAGFMGVQQGMPRNTQYLWAGMDELVKLHPNTWERIVQILSGSSPMGDQPIDHMWNKQGMTDGESLLIIYPNKYNATIMDRILRTGPY